MRFRSLAFSKFLADLESAVFLSYSRNAPAFTLSLFYALSLCLLLLWSSLTFARNE